MTPFLPVVQYPRWLRPHYGIVAALAQVGLGFLLPEPWPGITAIVCVLYNVFGWGFMYAAGRHYLRGMADAFAFSRQIDAAFRDATKRGLSVAEAAAEVQGKFGVSEEPKH